MRKKGFTLVELMVVVAIIILLAAILIPRYIAMDSTAKSARCHANQRTLEFAGAMYMGDVFNTAHALPAPGGLAILVPNYMPQIPTCPENGAYDITAGGLVFCSYGGTHIRNDHTL